MKNFKTTWGEFNSYSLPKTWNLNKGTRPNQIAVHSDLGGSDNKAIVKSELPYKGYNLTSNPTVTYSTNQCIKYIDLELASKTNVRLYWDSNGFNGNTIEVRLNNNYFYTIDQNSGSYDEVCNYLTQYDSLYSVSLRPNSSIYIQDTNVNLEVYYLDPNAHMTYSETKSIDSPWDGADFTVERYLPSTAQFGIDIRLLFMI